MNNKTKNTKLLNVAKELALHKVPVDVLQECIDGVVVEYVRGTKTIRLPRYVLYRLYVKYELRQSIIGLLLGCSQDTVSRYLRLYNIPRRQSKLEMSKRTIIHLYLGEKKSAGEIAAVYHCSKMTILRRLHAWGILSTGNRMPEAKTSVLENSKVPCIAEEVGPLIELDYINGVSYAKLSEKYGITRYRLKKYLLQAGLALRQSKERICLDVPRMVALYQEGATVQTIARGFGVGCTTVAERLKEQGIVLRGNKKSIDEVAVVKRYNNHVPMLRIAEETGYSYEAIRRCVREQRDNVILTKKSGCKTIDHPNIVQSECHDSHDSEEKIKNI